MARMTDVTQILNQIEDGDPSAAEKLLPLVYKELRLLAANRLANEKPGQTLQATALVHEAYVRLVDVDKAQNWNSRGHFFSSAAEAMRRILVENARRKQSVRHGGAMQRLDAEMDQLPGSKKSDEVLNIDQMLQRLESNNPDVAKLVEFKYFAGFTLDEAASAMGISTRTAHRYWAYAKAWLRTAIEVTNNE